MKNNKTIINSWNEWDQLRHVIVGTADNANIPPMEPALEPKISEDSGMKGFHGPRTAESIEKANLQLNNFVKILKSFNIGEISTLGVPSAFVATIFKPMVSLRDMRFASTDAETIVWDNTRLTNNINMIIGFITFSTITNL